MGMSAGGGSGVRSEINITPLVDVVLVLLIIFMVVTPLLQVGYRVEVPPVVDAVAPPPPGEQLVARLDREGRTWLNGRELAPDELRQAIARSLVGRAERPLFVAVDDDVRYGAAVDFLDLCRSAGSGRLAVVLSELGAAPAEASR